MTTSTSQPFSPVEHAWIRSEAPANLPISMVVLVCEETLDPTCVKSRIEDRLLAEIRLRQTIGHSPRPLTRPRWQEHEEFQLSDHFFRVDLRDRPVATALAEWIGHLGSQPLDEARPLWQLHLAELAGGASALVFRLHAAVADSRAAGRLALRLVDGESPAALTEIGLEHHIERQPLRARAGGTAAATRMLCQLITSRVDGDSPFRQDPIGPKNLRWSDPVALTDIQSPATARLLAAVAGSLRKAAQRQDTPAEDIDLRAIVSLDLRAGDDALVGTRSALGLMRLPVSTASQTARTARLEEEIDRLARTPEDFALLGCETGLGLSMSEIEERSLRLLSQKATVALAILDGPAARQSLCGTPVSQLLWWPALTGEIALGISMVAYAGQVQFAVSCDAALQTDATALMSDTATLASGR